MRKNILRIVLFISFACLSSCSNQPLRPDSPDNTALLVKRAVDARDLDRLKPYMSEFQADKMTIAELENLSSISTSGAEIRTYGFLEFDNGEILLLDMYKDQNGDYKVQELIRVPEAFTTLFAR